MDKVDLTVIVLARNEEERIAECLQSCAFAKELLVIDDGSTDQTVPIAVACGAKVLQRSMNGDWGAQQTFGINSASCAWIFFIDADERVTPTLAENIIQCVQKNEKKCYWIQRENHFQNIKATHGIMRPDWVARLMPKEGSYVEGRVHPKIVTPYPNETISGRMIHFPYRDWDAYFRKFDKYTSLSAQKYLDSGRHSSFLRDIVLRPLWAFIKVYFLNLSFLDGKAGWIFSVNHYFYTMMKYVKLYTLEKYKGRL